MPELPEVETVRRGLEPHLAGKTIKHVLLRRRDLRVPLPDKLEHILKGKTLSSIDRRAKYLLLHFDEGQVLIIHLGMSGRILLERIVPDKAYLKHDHVVIDWDNGYRLIFNDARRFGLMLLTSRKELASHTLLKDLGPEPLGEEWNGTSLYTILQASRAPVKSVIMDQRKLVGVGNIYACEALFRAGIKPSRLADTVKRQEAHKLAGAIVSVLKEAIVSGGSTLRDYVRSSGDTGYFQHHFNVYGRHTLPCYQCKNPIALMRQSGRSTFYCNHCQR